MLFTILYILSHPFFAILLFLISYRSSERILSPLYILIIGSAVSLLSSFASNLWNHANDLKEDTIQGRKTALTLNFISQKTAIALSVLLYGISTIVVVYISIKFEKPIYFFFLLWALITWWYSDNIFLRKIVGFRLKSHYAGEIITYGIAYPFYTLSIWLIYSNLNASGIALALSFLFFGISGVFLKDLKDISGDQKAGLKTLGVMFGPSKLIHISCFLLILYYLVILSSASLKFFNTSTLLIIIPFIWFIKNTFFHFHKKSWKLEITDFNSIKTMIISTYLSLFILGISALI